jgi:hypothetical protein
MALTNDTINTSSIAGDKFSTQTKTWAEMTLTWADYPMSWDNPQDFSNDSINTSTISND